MRLSTLTFLILCAGYVKAQSTSKPGLISDSTVHVSDKQRIYLTPMSGVKHMPIGGLLKVSYPGFYNASTFSTSLGYQTDYRGSNMLTADLALDHFITSPDYTHDLKFRFRSLNRPRTIHVELTNVLTQLNFKSGPVKNLGFIAGYFHTYSSFVAIVGEPKYVWRGYGATLGLQHNLNFLHRNGHVMGTASLTRHTREFQGEIYVEPYKSFQTFVRYYSLGTFNEYTVGIGWRFVYRQNKNP